MYGYSGCALHNYRVKIPFTDCSMKGGIWNRTVWQPCPAPSHTDCGGDYLLIHWHSSVSFCGYIACIAYHLKNKTKVLIISWQNVKACPVPLSFSSQSKIVWENIEISRWFSWHQEMVWTAWLTKIGWDPEEYVTKFQAPCQFWKTLDNRCSIQGRDSRQHLEQFSGSLSCACLPFGFSLLPAGASRPARPVARLSWARQNPKRALTLAAESALLSPLSPSLCHLKHCMVGGNKASVPPDLKHCSWQPLPSPINSELNTTIWVKQKGSAF